MITASAPGKVILFGEHAVVYGRPAIAVPVTEVQATVTVSMAAGAHGITIDARDQARIYRLDDVEPSQPLAALVRLALDKLAVGWPDGLTLTIESSIPIAGGLGSGAAVSTALARALAAYAARPLDDKTVSDLVFQVEKIHHGTPSGIDNTVIAYAQPVYFVRDRVLETFQVPRPFDLLIADTGITSPTKIAVGDVRRLWQSEPARFEALFDACGRIADRARGFIEAGQPELLGPLMIENHKLLREMSVSCAELDSLVETAVGSGALGAKLSGGGRGGNLVALVTASAHDRVRAALLAAGARAVIATRVASRAS